MSKIKKSVLAGLAFALIFGIYLTIAHDLYFALFVGTGSGVFFSVGAYFKIFYKMESNPTNFQKLDKSIITYSGLANHFKDGISVGGKLSLSKRELIFQTNLINFMMRHQHIIDLDQISEIRFKDTFGFISNGLSIKTNDGNIEQFVVNKRLIWKEQIQSAIANSRL
jgi:hypothetical protein